MEDLFNGDNGAEFSKCGKYRYKLWRIWDRSKPIVMCIGLNPSTANSEKDDSTINVLKSTLYKLGYGGFYMTNLFAIISSDPKILKSPGLDLQKENNIKLVEVASICHLIIVCWGSFPEAVDRIKEILPMFPEAKCFGVNADGTPYHPRAMIYKKGMLANPKLEWYADRG